MLHIWQSNRLEALAEALAETLQRPQRPVLRPETILTPTHGVTDWLRLWLARRLTICANLQLQLPTPYLAGLAQYLGFAATACPPEQMAWRLYTLLGNTALELPPALQSQDARQRYALATQLARHYADYARYRPEWLVAWEAGDTPHWQARLWAALKQARPDTWLPSQILHGLKTSRSSASAWQQALPARLTLFGFSSLAPLEWAVFEALSQHTEVSLLTWSPCQEYWGDIRSARQISRQLAHGDPEAQHRTEGHRILAAWGAQSREFFELFLERGHDDPHAAYVVPDERTLLGQLQADLLYLRPDDSQPKRYCDPADRSIQIHSAHSPMRELEILHDQLLHLFGQSPELTPGDVAVLIPALELYAPYVEAVFGHAPESRYIPYTLADRGQRRQRPLCGAFVQLLAQLPSRWGLSEILDLLEIPALARRFDLTAAELPRIRYWLEATHTRWGIDAAQRAALGLPATDEHSFRATARRLLLGYALPEASAGYQGIAPYPEVEGADALVLGRLLQCLETLFQLNTAYIAARPLGAWCADLWALAQRLFLPDPMQEGEMDDYADLRAACVALAEAESDCPAAVAPEVVVQALQARLDQAITIPFLQGRVNFCALTPARALPFQVICLLGLDHGAFPRVTHRAEFDLLATDHRLGDRTRFPDDRALFLQILHAARQCLYLSFVGRDPRDDSLRPPSVLLSELQETLVAGYVKAAPTHEHPLQPFHPRYFQPGSPLSSYAREWLAASSSAQQPRTALSAFCPATLAPQASAEFLDLEVLSAFWQHPGRALLQAKLGARLLRLEDSVMDTEPFDLDAKAQNQLFRTLWALEPRPTGLEAWRQQLALLRAQSQLPHGATGAARWELLARDFYGLQYRIDAAFGARLPAQRFSLTLTGTTLHGSLNHLHQRGIGHYAWAKLRAKHRLTLWVEHLVWQTLNPSSPASRWLGNASSLYLHPLDATTARQHLTTLIQGYWEGQTQPLAFFPDTSYAYQKHIGEEGAKAWGEAHKQWETPQTRDKHFPGERDDPYTRILWGEHCDLSALGDRFTDWAARVYAPLIQHSE